MIELRKNLTFAERRELVFWRRKWRNGDFFTKDPALAQKIANSIRAALGEKE